MFTGYSLYTGHSPNAGCRLIDLSLRKGHDLRTGCSPWTLCGLRAGYSLNAGCFLIETTLVLAFSVEAWLRRSKRCVSRHSRAALLKSALADET